jgi:hypothetical protein
MDQHSEEVRFMKTRFAHPVVIPCLVIIVAGITSPANASVLPYIAATSAFVPPNLKMNGTSEAFVGGTYYDTPTGHPERFVQSSASGNDYGTGPVQGSAGYVIATADQMRNSDQVSFGSTDAIGTAKLTYDFGIVPTGNPPSFVNQFLNSLSPVFVNAVVTVSGSAQGNAFAGGEAQFFVVEKLTGQSRLVDDVGSLIVPGDPPVRTFPVSLDFVPLTEEIKIVLSADADVQTSSTIGFLNGSAIGAADPTFEFDQASFDAEAAQFGFQTFPLDQAFSFEFSAGLDQLGVPEPSSFAIVTTVAPALAAAYCFRLAKRRKRS